MARWSNIITACINFASLLLGLGVLAFSMTMAIDSKTSCLALLSLPSFRVGTLIVVISIFGLLGSVCRSPFCLWIYLMFYFIIIIVMGIGVFLWSKILIRGHIRLDVGEEHRFKEFGSWFKDNVLGLTNWKDVRQCMIDTDLCFWDSSRTSRFYSVPTVKSLCCQKPPWCTYDPNNGTIPDCHTWSTEKDKMCYYCDACLGAFLQQVGEIWRKIFPGYAFLFVVCIFIFVFGYRAFRQHKNDHYNKVCYNTKA